MPAWFAELLIVIIVALCAAGIHYAVRQRFPYERLRKHNDVAGFLFSVVGVIYAVVLGFVVVVAWEKYDATVANANTEVAAVSDLYRSVATFPAPLRHLVRRELHHYIDVIINDEWPAMEHGHQPMADLDILENVAADIETYDPVTSNQHDAHAIALGQIDRLFDARRLRILEMLPSVPGLLWFALVAGALATLGFAYLFGVEDRGPQMIMTAILAGVITILFIVIYEFDFPFGGSISVPSTGWTYLHSRLPHIH